MSRFRVIVLFGGIPLLGQERGNLEVVEALKPYTEATLFLTHDRWGHQVVEPELQARGFAFQRVRYSVRFERGMGLRRLLVNLRDIGTASVQLERAIRRFRPTPIHVFNPAFFLNFLPVLMLTRVSVVYRVGDEPAVHRALYRVLWQWFIMPRVDRFVCVSRFIEAKLIGLGVLPAKVDQIYSRPPHRAAGRDQDIPARKPDCVTFVFVGQLIRDKGVDLLVDAAMIHCRRFPATRFLIAGDYSWNNPLAMGLIERVSIAGFDSRIVFLGYVDRVDHLLTTAHVHVCPSVCNEALGNVVMEAKLAGIPSVVFPSGGLPELVKHGVDGYLCSDKTPDALLKAFLRYQDDPIAVRRQGEAARRSLERLEIDRFAERWLAVYEAANG